MSDQLELNVDIQYKDNTLVVLYSVRNHSDTDAYLMNQLFKTTPAWDVGPHVVYVALDEDAREIKVSKKIADIPSDKYVLSPVVPFVTPLRAGDEFSEQIDIPAPVQEFVQYGSRPVDEEALPQDFSAVSFELGFMWRAAGGTEPETEVQGEKYILPKNPPGVLSQGSVLKHGPVAVNVPVLMPKIPEKSNA